MKSVEHFCQFMATETVTSITATTAVVIVVLMGIAFGCGFSHAKRAEQDVIQSKQGTVESLHPLEAAEGYRQKASTHAETRGRYFKESQDAYRRGDKAKAKFLADQGKVEGNLMDQCNERAAATYFNHNNTNTGLEVDLHGLHVKEALIYVEQSIQHALKREGEANKHVVFIVGLGNHSQGGLRKIEPAIEEMVKVKYGYACIDGKPRKGCLWVDLMKVTTVRQAESNIEKKKEKKEMNFCAIS
jgi:DNA-nicking Smr family endonuclease